MAVAYEKISWVASLLVLLLGFASCSSQGGGEFTHRSLNFWKAARARVPPTGPNTGTSRKFNFGTLPKGTLIPPSWPSKRTSRPPPPPPHPSNFGTLPKNTPIPPSGPSGRTSDPPPPPYPFNFGTLPKYTPIPPSGPSGRTSDPPPPPHPFNFGTLPKYTPIPPSGPSGRTSSPPPPPHPFNFKMQYSGPSHGPPRYEIPSPPAF
ncbi:PREDICTED: arp2/3 complex-activating protein rickA-like [Prunus mume]|uniref:Arp2/3 complex-activating protein rickA-like n=1 Tax=Prunus mume TaxID=102107 RepID=A0ABM0PQ40_PRUMU|nr:PREDICTED: arp2/3 complex-activating protein rickA-like [Prunus mume]